MLVITAIVGFAISVNNSISLKWFIPISTTIAFSSLSSSIVIGIPILLFILPLVFNVLYFEDNTDAIISLVLVFPTLPVTATTGILNKLLLYLAISCNAFNVSATKTNVVLFFFAFSTTFAFSLLIIHTLAPASIAFSTKSFPSNFSPIIAIYAPFFLTNLESLQKSFTTVFPLPVIIFPSISFKKFCACITYHILLTQ